MGRFAVGKPLNKTRRAVIKCSAGGGAGEEGRDGKEGRPANVVIEWVQVRRSLVTPAHSYGQPAGRERTGGGDDVDARDRGVLSPCAQIYGARRLPSQPPVGPGAGIFVALDSVCPDRRRGPSAIICRAYHLVFSFTPRTADAKLRVQSGRGGRGVG